MFSVLDCLAVLVYVAAFIFFALKDPEQLRTEKYSIQKMAIEKGFVGDDVTGYIMIPQFRDLPMIADRKGGEEPEEDK